MVGRRELFEARRDARAHSDDVTTASPTCTYPEYLSRARDPISWTSVAAPTSVSCTTPTKAVRTRARRTTRRSLERRGITCSMSRRGNCYDNAVMESFLLNGEERAAGPLRQLQRATRESFDYIEVFFYNQRRRHSTLGQISPAALSTEQQLKRPHDP